MILCTSLLWLQLEEVAPLIHINLSSIPIVAQFLNLSLFATAYKLRQ